MFKRNYGVILILLSAFAFVGLSTSPAEAIPRGATITIDPKIIDPGDTPAPAADAAARGSVKVTGDLGDAQGIFIQSRPVGTTTWETIATHSNVPVGSTVYFNAWSCCEYRVSMYEGTPNTYSAIVSYDHVRTFVDEFSGTTLDTTKWVHRRPNTWNTASGGTCSLNTTDTVTVSGGTAKFKSLVNTAPVPPYNYTQAQKDFCDTHGWYKDSMIGTQGIFENAQGWYSARVKTQRWQGSHTCFWMQGVNGYAASGGEIDINEYFGNNGTSSNSKIWHNRYWNWDGGAMEENKASTQWDDALDDPAGGDRFWNMYNVYTLHWSPTQSEFYVNGKLLKTFTTPDFTSDGYMILSNQVRDYEIDERIHTEEASYVMEVDWVQAWEE